MGTLAVGAMLTGVVVGAASSAVTVCLRGGPDCSGRLEMSADGRVSPLFLPKGKLAPIGFTGGAQISTSGGSHPSALREAALDIDRDVEVDAAGLPACGYRRIASRNSAEARRVCRKAIVGSGSVTIALSSSGDAPLPVGGSLTLFNGGVRDGVNMLLIHGFLPAPVRQTAVARMEMVKREGQALGFHTSVDIPRIADGLGSLIEFELRARRIFFSRGEKKSYLSARCPDGHFKLKMPKLLFRNELRTPGVAGQTVLKGTLAIPCTPAR